MTTPPNDDLSVRTPHVDTTWVEDFVLELRLRGASGAAIGAALLEVESHMAEQGGEVTDAFGDPKEYATSLDLPDTQQWTASQVVYLFVKGILGIVAAGLLVAGIATWSGDGTHLSLAATGVVLLGAVALMMALGARDAAALRLLLDHPLAGGALVTVVVAAVAVLATVVPGPVVVVPPELAVGGGLVALAALVATVRFERTHGSTLQDPITFPAGPEHTAPDDHP